MDSAPRRSLAASSAATSSALSLQPIAPAASAACFAFFAPAPLCTHQRAGIRSGCDTAVRRPRQNNKPLCKERARIPASTTALAPIPTRLQCSSCRSLPLPVMCIGGAR